MIADRVAKKENQEQIAADYGITQPRVNQIAKKEGKRREAEKVAKAALEEAKEATKGFPWGTSDARRVPNARGADLPGVPKGQKALIRERFRPLSPTLRAW